MGCLNCNRINNTLGARLADIEELAGCFGYLSAPADTTIVESGTYQPLVGTFTHPVCELFAEGTAETPSIKYTGTTTRKFKIDWCAAGSADLINTTVKIGVKHYNASEETLSFVTGSDIPQFYKNDGQTYNLSGCCVVELAENDEVQLVVTSNGTDDVITTTNFTTTIAKFFNV